MTREEFLAEEFEEHRHHLKAVAYRMLGSATEADDAVQEAWLRLQRTDATDVDNLGAWLTTVVSRVCLNVLRARRARRRGRSTTSSSACRTWSCRSTSTVPRTRPCSPTRSGSPSSSCSTH